MHSDGFAFGMVLGIGGGVALTVGVSSLVRRLTCERSLQQNVQSPSLVQSVNGLANELRQLRNLVATLERQFEAYLGLYERQRSVANTERAAITIPTSTRDKSGHTHDTQNAINRTTGTGAEERDEEESSSDDNEFYEIPSEFPASDHQNEDEEEEINVEDEEARDTQKLELFLEEIDRLSEDCTDYDESQCRAYTLLMEKRQEICDHPALLWRQARANFGLCEVKKKQANTKQERKDLLYEGIEFAKTALALDDSIWQTHKWLAITTGSTAEFEGTQKKIQNGYVFKEHIDRALELKGDDPNLWHLLGRWCFEVASLSWWEKKGAAALYATPPESTYEQSLEAFLKAEELKPNFWKTNQLFLCKCYTKLGDNVKAKEWLLKANDLAVVTQEDTETQQEVQKLLSTFEHEL
ncbi:regulator of microtubule dynamics protein 1-like [Corticium candelabrum]|uniref:regulator of microtubule dynamics protein 1-like n=1 Tax=Corticium candelabrum TaxID=121492 RepID=UPI002E26E2E8|nr:regulator of microtubule dynamics protein 1-like [Corticium candelabrum]